MNLPHFEQETHYFKREMRNDVDWMVFINFFQTMLANVKHTSSYLSDFMLSLLRLLKNILSFEIHSVLINSPLIKELTKALRIDLDKEAQVCA